MDFSTTIDLIIKDLKEASEIIDDLKKYPGVPLLQVELAKSKCRSAGDVIALLKTYEPALLQKEQVEVSTPAKQPSVEKIKPKKTVSIEFTEEKKENISHESVTLIADERKSQSEQSVKNDETPTIAEMYSSQTDLYEETALGKKAEKDLSDKLKAGKIKSITEAIGISDKFLFIGSIFDGNKEAYSQAIAGLDNVSSVDEAMSIILKYPDAKPDSDAVLQLIEIVKLKLGIDE